MEAKDFFLELDQIFDDLPKELYDELDVAHNRYEHLIDITSAAFPVEMVEQDRLDYPQYINKNEEGLPIFDDEHCAQFMSEKTNIPVLLCRMYIHNDFNWTILSGFVEDPEESLEMSKDQLIKELKNDQALSEVLTFLINRGLLASIELGTEN